VNKNVELFYLHKFKENFPQFPQGEICAHERPDFLVTTNEGRVGIEITEFYRDMAGTAEITLQQRRAIHQQILNHAKSIADKRGLLGAHIQVHFDTNFYCKASETISIASKLVQLAEGMFTGESSRELLKRDEIQIEGIPMLSVWWTKGTTSFWKSPWANFVPGLLPEQIQGVLDAKTKRQSDYRKICDQIWLVIVMDRFKTSSFALIPPETLKHRYTHKFDLAFLFFHTYDREQQPPFLLEKA
jgi:hypothetical protein